MSQPITIEYGLQRIGHIDKYKTIPYTFIIFKNKPTYVPGLRETVIMKHGVKIFDNGFIIAEHIQGKCERTEKAYKALKKLSLKERLEYVENIKKSLENIDKFNL